MIPILVPLADGQGIPSVVVHGIHSQDIEVSLFPVTSPMQAVRRSGEAVNRNILFDIFAYMKCDIAFMMNRDIWLKSESVVSRAVKAIDARAGIVAVHVPHKPGADPFHMDIGCMAIHRSLCGKVVFPSVTDESCLCGKFSAALVGHGLRQMWLPTLGDELDAKEVGE